ncbi:hypothetical protein [Buttiauxella noackiae]|uniref:hypothetical protein n=1 Tax=Buttiauxella noackiae TaxID=82992 RepID=UPI00054F21C3|nr:hypothetical protein [Buttiauxella noackiae]
MKSVLAGLLMLASCSASAIGISAEEYQKMIDMTQCAFIANSMKSGAIPVETVDKAFLQSVELYKKNTGLMRGFDYNPAPEQLAIDFAVHYQQNTSDLYDEMFQALKAQGLPLAPESWFKISAQYWLSKGCQSIVG